MNEVIDAFYHEEMIENGRTVEEFNRKHRVPREFIDV